MGYQSLMADLGIELPLRMWTDSTATIGICGRDGLGKLRHIDTQCLWLQQKVRSGAIDLRKVRGTENPADLFTKHLTSTSTVRALMELFNCVYRDGRPEGAPKLRKGMGTTAGEELNVVDKCHELGKAQDLEDFEESASTAATKALVQCGDYTFPGVEWEGELVPEARSYKQTRLPHQTGSLMNELFPKAEAVEDPGDRDLWGELGDLERAGLETVAKSMRRR